MNFEFFLSFITAPRTNRLPALSKISESIVITKASDFVFRYLVGSEDACSIQARTVARYLRIFETPVNFFLTVLPLRIPNSILETFFQNHPLGHVKIL